MKRSILIFGAGINQLTLIKAAKKHGITSVVIDPNPEALGRSLADCFYCVAGNDYEGTKKIALKHKVNGIVTSQIEKPLRLMAQLSSELGFIFHEPDVVERSLDKWLMKKGFFSYGVPCAKGKLFKKEEKIIRAKLNHLTYPLIIKPKDATSSQGVFKINHFKEIGKHIGISRSFFVQFTEKFITSFPRTVEIGHLQPASLNSNQKSQIDVVVKEAIKAIGIDNSASHTEIKLTPDGPKTIEIGARLGGDFIASYLTLASTGVNMDKAAIQVALGEKPDLENRYTKYSFIKYLELEPGKEVVNVKDYSDISNEQAVVFANIFVKKGDIIPEITDSAKRPAFVIVQADTKSQVINYSSLFEEKLKSKILLGGVL
jgi:biotin carboxylase